MVRYERSDPSRAREWLRDARFQKDLRAWQLAWMVGICENYYTKIELGLRNPSVRLAKEISRVLEISWTRFFD